jgi:glycopeptide antibiotics resistance protein
MGEELLDYCLSLWNDIPRFVSIFVILTVFIGSVFFLKWKGINQGLKYSIWLILAGYVVIVLCSTVFYRSHAQNAGLKFVPFWSYQSYFKGEDDSLLLENIMNVIVFFPIGLMLACVLTKNSFWKAALLACVISVSIEVMQFFTKNGFCEIDDVIHNTLGCVVGYGMYYLVRNLLKRYDIKISI